jgi:hypothetical protein
MKQTTKPWLPIDSAWWQNIAIELPKPWPRDAVMMDLRWWADQERMGRKKRPGRPTLCKRWGVSDRQVRNALKAEDIWGGQRPDSQRTAPVLEKPAKQLESQAQVDSDRTAGGQPASPRAEIHKNTSTQLHKHEVNKTNKVGSDSLDALWEKVNAIRTRAGHTRKLALPPARRRVLRARVREHSEEDVLRVIEWWLFSPHHRAEFLREKGCAIKTIISPSLFPEYLEYSHEENQASSKPKGLREMMEEINEQREPLNVYHFNNQE